MKKMRNEKVENYALFGGLAEDLSPGDSLSDSSEGLFRRGKGGARIYRSFCKKTKTNRLTKQKNPGSWNMKRLLLIKENLTSQVNEYGAFLCMGGCKSLGSLKSFL